MPSVVDLSDWAQEFLRDARTGHLATVGADGRPHVVPVCYVLFGEQIVTPIDEKPKSGKTLTRLRNIAANPQVAMVVDRYDEDWTRLAWVQVRGAARLLQPGAPAHAGSAEALRVKYPQYRTMHLDEMPFIAIAVTTCRTWRWSEA